jgi:2-phospho-L-lactate guanylyltransferase (CobY/MobA/RfbA family)
LQLVINPNTALGERPVVALTMAILTNTDVDLNLSSDHRIRQASLGLEDGTGVVVGDLAMARYVVQRSKNVSSLSDQAMQDSWLDYAQSLSQLPQDQRCQGVAMTLEHALLSRTYLVGNSLTVADVAVFGALGFPTQAAELTKLLNKAFVTTYPTATRWVTIMAHLPALQRGNLKNIILHFNELLCNLAEIKSLL